MSQKYISLELRAFESKTNLIEPASLCQKPCFHHEILSGKNGKPVNLRNCTNYESDRDYFFGIFFCFLKMSVLLMAMVMMVLAIDNTESSDLETLDNRYRHYMKRMYKHALRAQAYSAYAGQRMPYYG